MKVRYCDRCHGRHRFGACPLDRRECMARLDDPFAGRHAVCILARDHRGGTHWGPDRDGNYVEWPVSRASEPAPCSDPAD